MSGVGDHHDGGRRARARVTWGAVLIVTVACAANHRETGTTTPGAEEVPLLDGLGDHGRAIMTSSPQAQRYFNQGLNFLYAFNHDEAIRAFTRATELDPHAAMPWWGIALARGPHINNPVLPEARARDAWDALQEALRRSGSATAVERALIDALTRRYDSPPPDERRALDEAYADAMRTVWQRFPDDGDVGGLFAEAMMNLRPWDLWTDDGAPQPGTTEIVSTLEDVLKRHPRHPLALHLYIHAVEASPHPERADDEADRLRDLAPALGHLVHMPSHIDVRRGRWREAIVANEKALAADRAYRELRPLPGFYGLYMAHNHHMLAYAAMMTGESAKALAAIDAMMAAMPERWRSEYAPIADGFLAMPLEVRVRFGRWDEVLAAPEPDERYPFARAMRHQARGVALAAQGKTAEAREEQRLFDDARARVPAEQAFGNNRAHDLLEVAAHMLEGEVLYREGHVDEGLAALRRAVGHEDRLHYAEPPDWILPVRHALGATLMQEGRAEEAEAVFRADLARLPENGWSLFGLSRALHLQGEHDEAHAVAKAFDATWARADVPLKSSCFCQPGN